MALYRVFKSRSEGGWETIESNSDGSFYLSLKELVKFTLNEASEEIKKHD